MRYRRHENVASGDGPDTVPERDASKVDARALFAAAGVDLPERPIVSRLTSSWQGHHRGAYVVFDDNGDVYIFDR